MMRRVLLGLLKLAVTGAILALILRRMPLGELGASIRSADAGLFALSVAVTIPVMGLAAVQIRILTRGQGMAHTLGALFRINLVTDFYRVFLPGDLASGVVRWHQLAGPEKMRAQALAVIVYNRLVELGSTAVLGIAFWAVDPLARENRLVPLAFLALIALILLMRTVLFSAAPAALFLSTLRRLPAEGLAGGFRKRMGNIVSSCAEFRHLSIPDRLAVLATSIGRHVIGLAALLLLARALELDLDYANLGWVRSAVLLVTFLPVTISGFGLREGSFLVLLEPYGVAGPDAVALSLLLYAQSLFPPVLGGGVVAARFLRGRRDPGATS